MAIWRTPGFIVASVLLSIGGEAISAAQAPATTKRTTNEKGIEKPQWTQLRKVVDRYFAEQRGRSATDILTASEARATLDLLGKAGWKPKDSAKLLARVLGDGDFLVRELKSKEGRKFLSATSSEGLVYDRLDRLTKYSGGDRLVTSVIHLPNGPAFMRPKPTPGFGTLMDLLPKEASGKTPVDPQFNKPTGKIYTSAQWIKELESAHQAESKPAASNSTAK